MPWADSGLKGHRLAIPNCLALVYAKGWKRRWKQIKAVAIICAESARYARAWHDNLDADGNVVSRDRGL